MIVALAAEKEHIVMYNNLTLNVLHMFQVMLMRDLLVSICDVSG